MSDHADDSATDTSSPTATCSSPSPTRCWDRRPTPRTSSRKPGCGGSRPTWDRCSDQRAYLVRITTRQSLNRLRTMKRRREAYVGSWLPEPLLTAPDVAEDVELAERVDGADDRPGDAAPTERAVFVLREVFGHRLRRNRGRRRQEPGRRPPDRAPRPPARRRPPASREGGLAEPRPGRLWERSSAVETGDLQGLARRARPGRRPGGRRRRRSSSAVLRPITGRREGGPHCSSVVSARSTARSPTATDRGSTANPAPPRTSGR